MEKTTSPLNITSSNTLLQSPTSTNFTKHLETPFNPASEYLSKMSATWIRNQESIDQSITSTLGNLTKLSSQELLELSNLNFFLTSTFTSNNYFFNTLAFFTLHENSPIYVNQFLTDFEQHETLDKIGWVFSEADMEAEKQWEASLPDVKLYYPEPFIASPSFNHEDIWFIHILHYNYWLWFFFISLIMFYFITFINVVRWCNLRAKPKRETRGVSRSKCADLITACVPVSWAISIIISETVDATDYYDGFGTGEIVIGIRAYQWGWEYFYPKSIDLNYNVKQSYSSFIGNSLKYSNASHNDLEAAVLWKYYQAKNNTGQASTPAHLLLSPSDTSGVLNNIDFSHVGNSISKDTAAFKKIQTISKLSNNAVDSDTAANNALFRKINNLYINNSALDNNSYYYGTARQHNLTSSSSTLPSYSTLMDKKSFNKFFDYSAGTDKLSKVQYSSVIQNKEPVYNSTEQYNKSGINLFQPFNINSTLNSTSLENYNPYSSLATPAAFFNQSRLESLNTLTDKQNVINPLKPLDSGKKLSYNNSGNFSYFDELLTGTQNNFFSWNLFNESVNYRFQDSNSGNLKFLSFEKNSRNLANQKLRTFNQNLNNTSDIGLNNTIFSATSQYDIYLNSLNNWNNSESLQKALSSNVTSSLNRHPIQSTNPSWTNLGYDRVNAFSPSDTPEILRGKEDMAPDYLFNTYWHSYWKNISLGQTFYNTSKNINQLENFYLPTVSEYSEYDFRNWQALEALEDSYWESNYSSVSHDDYMTVKNSSKTSEFFNKAQMLYNLNVRGELLNNKPVEALQFNTSIPEFVKGYFTYTSNIDLGIVSPYDFRTFPQNIVLNVKWELLNNKLVEAPQFNTPIPEFVKGYFTYTSNINLKIVSPYDFRTFPQNTIQVPSVFLLSDSERWGLLSTVLYDIDGLVHNKVKFKSVYKPFLKSTSYNSVNTSLPLYSEDLFFNPSNFNTLNFNIYNNETLFDTSDDSYENLKNFQLLYTSSYQNASLKSYKYLLPTTYTTVLDAFRADYDDYNWNFDYEYALEDTNVIDHSASNSLTNKIKLRSPAKNAIVNYSAIQKVYKSRFDDFRSNADFKSFSNSYAAYPFITEEKTPYESLLAKNNESFFNINFYNTEMVNNYSVYSSVWNANNTLFLDIPFLLSMKSDASRYLWFDWQARWSSIEVQPSSIAKFSLAGVPYFSKTFEYSTQLMEELNDSENYLTKLSRARQNYMPNWAYSPYLYNKVSNWFSYRYQQLFFDDLNSLNTKVLLKVSAGYWKPSLMEGSHAFSKLTMTPSSSGLNSPARVTWTPIRNLSGSYYTESILIDILSKREYLYRTFLKSKNNTVFIPTSLTASPNNSLLREVKSIYSFIDPATYGSELTREFLYQNSNYLRYIFIKDFLKLTNELHFQIPINFNLISNYFIHVLGPMDSYTTLGKNYDLYKSQYRPMRKGVTNMIRLQATNAIAMPTEIRLHILASSKDVIHSWAIPSAGIKIDCVPGYSSHRVAIFLTHGIYWGQCMEICGRYHHWMPIVVYFMKRDLFFLWCTHFMHYSNIENSFNMTDRQLTDYLRLVSFNKSTWVNELDKYIH